MELKMTVDISPALDLRVSTPWQKEVGMDSAIVVGGGVPYEGDYTVTPKAHEQTVLATKRKYMNDDVTVLEVPYFETSNESGTTVYIAREV